MALKYGDVSSALSISQEMNLRVLSLTGRVCILGFFFCPKQRQGFTSTQTLVWHPPGDVFLLV